MTTLLESLPPDARRRLVERERQVAQDPTRIRALFPAAARDVGRTPASTDPGIERIEDDVRGLLLDALTISLPDPDARSAEVHDLYRFGDADERRAVLHALHRLDLGDRATDLVHDGLRTNDARLVAAALGPYGAEVLDDHAWRQGVLKCLFTGVPIAVVDRFDERADAQLAAMVAAYADERESAGREVPDDARTILADHTSRES